MTEQERAAMQQALEAMLNFPDDISDEMFESITALRAALAQKPEPVCKCDLRTRLVGDGCEVCNPELAAELAQQPEPVTDPFADIRDKRMGELNMEQRDRATELWLREQIGPREDYWYPHLQTLFRIIDRLREQPEPAQEPVAWIYPDDYAGILKHQSRAEVFQKAWCNPAVCVPLYTTPPQRPPLTDAEILEAVGWERAEMYMKLTPNFQVDEAKKETLKNARAVERKVRGETE